MKLSFVGMLLAAAIFGGLLADNFHSWDSLPQVEWSYNRNACVSVEVKGKELPEGCERIKKGEIKKYEKIAVQ